MEKKIELLETTLRDGSYPIKFQFTATDTSLLCLGLEKAGFKLIEIGHGLGMNASNCGQGSAAEDDLTYMRAADSALKRAKFGMFHIPNIGRLQDIDLAAKNNMGFIRIGTNVTEIEQAEPHIKRAKDHGMLVFSNLMKSYALSPKELLKKAELAQKYGADVICLVDSAGGMTPKVVKDYISTMKNGLNTKLGYHGHNNLQLAIANSLAAYESGAEIIDTSLLGIGRSSGNTPTELMLLVLKKMGIDLNIDINLTLDLGYKFIAPYLANVERINPLHAIAGYAEFHSGFMKNVFKAAEKYNLNPRNIILEASKIDKINVSDELVEQVSKKLSAIQSASAKYSASFDKHEINPAAIKFNIKEDLERVLSDMQNISSKFLKKRIFVIAITDAPHDPTIILPHTIESDKFVIGSAEIFNNKHLTEIMEYINGKIDYVLIDSDGRNLDVNIYRYFSKNYEYKVQAYSENKVIVSAGESLISQLTTNPSKILILGGNNLAKDLALALAKKGYEVTIYDNKPINGIETINNLLMKGVGSIEQKSNGFELNNAVKKAEVIVGCTRHKRFIKFDVSNNKFLVDLGIGSFDKYTIDSALQKKIPLYRVDTKSALVAEITRIVQTDKHITKRMGKATFDGVSVVAGGIIGNKGDVVVDSISKPTQIIGIADGTGHVLYKESEFESRKQTVSKYILNNQLKDLEDYNVDLD
jgi:4-hydroxy-2-oxovalerate aldolase